MLRKKNIKLKNLGNGNCEVNLISEARKFRVNESEIMGLSLQLLIHYFQDGPEQKTTWRLEQQPKEINSNKEPDFWLKVLYKLRFLYKVLFEMKPPSKISFSTIMSQVDIPSQFVTGNKGGEYKKEFNKNKTEIKFSGSSLFVVIIRGTQIALLERYTYALSDFDIPCKKQMVPLTQAVDKTKGIENPRLAAIMDKYRDMCDKTLEFPYDQLVEVPPNFPGKYYVFDLINNSDACHELFQYISSELPRLHFLEDKEL